MSFVSAIPFIVGAVAYALIKGEHQGEAVNIGAYFSAVLLQGQLFLISVSFISTSLHRLWNSSHGYERPDIINGFSMLLFGIIGVFYGLNPEFAKLNSPLSRNMSLAFFIFSILFYYYTAVLSYQRPKKVAEALEEDVRDLGDRLSRRRSEEAEPGQA